MRTTHDRVHPKLWFGCGSKNWYQNGTLVSGNMDQSLRNPSCFILSHTRLCDWNSPRTTASFRPVKYDNSPRCSVAGMPQTRVESHGHLLPHPSLANSTDNQTSKQPNGKRTKLPASQANQASEQSTSQPAIQPTNHLTHTATPTLRCILLGC